MAEVKLVPQQLATGGAEVGAALVIGDQGPVFANLTAVLTDGAQMLTTAIEIGGSVDVGQALTATTNGLPVIVQWTKNGVDIAADHGGVSVSYTITNADLGAKIWWRPSNIGIYVPGALIDIVLSTATFNATAVGTVLAQTSAKNVLSTLVIDPADTSGVFALNSDNPPKLLAGLNYPTSTPDNDLNTSVKLKEILAGTTSHFTVVPVVIKGKILVAPVNVNAPSIGGNLFVGEVLTCNPGSWSGYPSPSFAFQWQRSTDAGVTWANIGTNSPQYTIVANDAQASIRCGVKAANSQAPAGVGPIYSAATTLVATHIDAPVEIAKGNLTGQGGLTYTVAATVAATQGALLAMVGGYQMSAGPTFTDSKGGVWTKAPGNPQNHTAGVAIFKRMIGGAPIAIGDTFTFHSTANIGACMLHVINLPSALAVPVTAETASGQFSSNSVIGGGASPGGDLGQGSSISVGVPAPSSGDSYQFLGFAVHGNTADAPGFGSDDSWIFFEKETSLGAQFCGFAIAYRKGGGGVATGTGLKLTPGAYQYAVAAWTEITAPFGGATSASGTPVGPGGTGTIANNAQLMAALNAGATINGGKTFTVADGVDLGVIDISGFNFQTNPISFIGGVGTKAQYLSFSNCHGITFKNIALYNNTGPAVNIANACTSITVENCPMNSGTTPGTQIGSKAVSIRNGLQTTNANLNIIGRGDTSFDDIQGYHDAVGVSQTDGVNISKLTITNTGNDMIDLYGVRNAIVDSNFAHDIVTGDGHPDFIQWADYANGSGGRDRSANITITNNGFQARNGDFPQGIFGNACDGLTVKNNWIMGTIYNTYVAGDCTNILFDGNFGQSTAQYGSGITIRSGSNNGTVSNNSIGGWGTYTEPGPPPIYSTNIVFTGNTSLGNRSATDYTDLDVWLAAHPTARRRLTT